ncbi:MAG: type II toxin-antitoxin system RelE/ParE family toxin [Candidatus Binatia bacterium]
MTEYRLLIKSSAAKDLDAVGIRGHRRRIVQRIHTLAADPRPQGSEKLAGYADRYRIRQGSYRIIYLIDDEHHEVTIFKIGHRKDVHR